jgi:hypothetical protein
MVGENPKRIYYTFQKPMMNLFEIVLLVTAG